MNTQRGCFLLRVRGCLSFIACSGLVFGTGLCVSHAQSQFGSVSGIVTDPSHALVSHAIVSATNQATNVGFSTVTTASGNYLIGGLLPGVYTVSTHVVGMKDFRVADLVVSAGQVTRADMELTLDSTLQTVTVSANAAQLNTESPTVVTKPPEQLVLQPATIAPSDQALSDTLLPYLPGQNEIGGRAVTAYGSRTYDRLVTLDGSAIGLSSSELLRMPRDTVIDLQATSLSADAEHQTSATSEMFTAKGTNDLHGTIWTEIQNQALDALIWYASPPRPPGIPTVGYGFTLGGPIFIPKIYQGRNKTFFFIGFQKFSVKVPEIIPQTIPTSQMISGNLQQLGMDIIDPQTGQPFPNATIPPSRISPVAQATLNQFYPKIGGDFIFNNYSSIFNSLEPFHDLFLRIDQQLGSKNSVSGTYGYNNLYTTDTNGDQTTVTNGNEAVCNPFCTTTGTGIQMYSNVVNFVNASAIHIFTPSLINEANFGIRNTNTSTNSSTNGASILQSLGLPSLPNAPNITGGPFLNVEGVSGVAFVTQAQAGRRIYTFHDTLGWTKGRSATKVGFELIRPTTSSTNYGNVFGAYSFTGLFTGSGFGDFLLGLPSQTSRSLPLGATGSEQEELGFFGEEHFQITKRLVIDAGLRIEYNSAPTEPYGRYYNFDLSNGDLVVPNGNSLNLVDQGLAPELLEHIITAKAAGFPSKLVKGQLYANPRLGFAYQIGKNTVIRGGYGMYGSLQGNGGPTGGPFTPGIQNFTNANNCNAAGACSPSFTLADPFPGMGVQSVSGLDVNGVNPNLAVPETHQWSLTVEQRLPASIVFRTSYTGSVSNTLPYQRNIDLPPASTIPFSQSRLIYPLYYSVTYADSGGNQSYEGLDAEFTRQFLNGLTFEGGYTLAKCITDDDEGGLEFNYGSWGPLGNTIEDPYNLYRDRGNCEQTPRQNFRTMYVFDSPVGSGRTWLNSPRGLGGRLLDSAIGGWTTSGFFIDHTGKFYTPLWSGFDAANTGQFLIRPDRICSGKVPNQSGTMVFNPACFVQPPSGRYGNAGTGIIEGLGEWRFDLGAYKYFTFVHDTRMPKLRIGMTSINILNHPAKETSGTSPFIINSPGTVAMADDTPYDSGTTANLGGQRQIRFELKLLW